MEGGRDREKKREKEGGRDRERKREEGGRDRERKREKEREGEGGVFDTTFSSLKIQNSLHFHTG